MADNGVNPNVPVQGEGSAVSNGNSAITFDDVVEATKNDSKGSKGVSESKKTTAKAKGKDKGSFDDVADDPMDDDDSETIEEDSDDERSSKQDDPKKHAQDASGRKPGAAKPLKAKFEGKDIEIPAEALPDSRDGRDRESSLV
jgi:hypothetical protein